MEKWRLVFEYHLCHHRMKIFRHSNDKSVQVVNADRRWQEDGHDYFILIFMPRKKKYVK